MKRVLFFLLFLILSIPQKSLGQEEDLSAELLAWYQQALPLFQEVVTGGQYSDAPMGYLGSPFYNSRKFDFGEIWVNGLRYTKVQLLYDAWRDEVLTFHPIYGQKILIKSEKIEKFVFGDGAMFLRLDLNPGYGKHHHGFYQVLADGEPQLLKKHFRTVESVKEPGLITREFRVGQDYFYWFQGEFWKAGNKNEAMTGLGLSKKEVNNHFRGKRTLFKDNPEAYLRELLLLRSGKAGEFKGFPSR
jgi:hypothetical protein